LGVGFVIFDFDHDNPSPGTPASRIMKATATIDPMPPPVQ